MRCLRPNNIPTHLPSNNSKRRATGKLTALVLSAAVLLPAAAPSSLSAANVISAKNSEASVSAQVASNSTDQVDSSLKDGLTLPAGARDAVSLSAPMKAPIDFSDVAPRWYVDTPDGTSVQFDIRTGPDGRSWSDWQPADTEDILSPQDVVTETFASMISVPQNVRTHRYIQSRLTLHSNKPGATPRFHRLTYTFINAGVTANPPKPQALVMGTPTDVPKPLMVSREAWGSPEGKSSPRWTPKFRRVTHIVIHHTATSNSDTDFAARVRAIWYFHTKTRGWGDVGYNYLIDPNGVIYEGRAGGDDVEAGHAYPFNAGSMGIGMVGNFMNTAPTAAAQAALIDLLSWKASQRGIDPLGVEPLKGYTDCGTTITYLRPTIAGHRDYKGTACGRNFNTSTCPGDKLWSMLPQIRASVVADQPPLRAVFTGHDTPGNIAPNAKTDVHIGIRNTGSLTWESTGQGAVRLSYKWLTPDGKAVTGAAPAQPAVLPRDVPFADAITVTARLVAPPVQGHYALVWDLNRDGQGWFADEGSRPLRVDVVVGKAGGDTVAPTSEVLPLPVYSSNTDVVVRWAGRDDPKGSGLASYDIQYRIIPQGTWTDWKNATSETQATFEGQDGYTYGFRSRARDASGNVEDWKDDPDAYTIIDTRPPKLIIDSPLNGTHVEPGDLIVKGRTEPGAFVTVNDKRATEANGVFTSTVEASGRDFPLHVSAADTAGNVASLEVTVQAAARYNDVPMSDPAFTAVEYLSDQGVVSGYGDGSFRPGQPVTRAQLLKTLGTALHWGLIKPGVPRYSDVAPDSWMYPFVETAAARKVLGGYTDGTFRPNSNITRGGAVMAIVKAAGWKLETPATGHFADVSTRNTLFPYAETAYMHGLIAPDDERNFFPGAVATRGAVSVMIYELLSGLINDSPPPTRDDQGQ